MLPSFPSVIQLLVFLVFTILRVGLLTPKSERVKDQAVEHNLHLFLSCSTAWSFTLSLLVSISLDLESTPKVKRRVFLPHGPGSNSKEKWNQGTMNSSTVIPLPTFVDESLIRVPGWKSLARMKRWRFPLCHTAARRREREGVS